MKTLFKELFFWILPCLLITGAVPKFFAVILHADLPLGVPLALAWFKLGLNYLTNRLQVRREKQAGSGQDSLAVRGLRLLSVLFTGGCALLIMAIINITPHSIFIYWLENPAHVRDAVIISNIFVLLACFFSALQCGAVITQRTYKPLLVLLPLLLSLGVTIRPNWLFTSLLGLAIVILLLTYIRKNLRLYLSVLLASAFLGFLFFSLFPAPQGSVLVNNFLSPQLRFAVNRLFPDYPLLMGLPGYGFAFSEDKLGGSPTLSSVNLFEVEGLPEKCLHLREEVFDLYTGTEWKLSIPPALPESSRVVTSPPPVQQTLLKLKLIKGPYFLLPHTLETTAIQFQQQVVTIPPQAAWDSSALLQKAPLPSGTVIYLLTGSQPASVTGQAPVEQTPEAHTSEPEASLVQTPPRQMQGLPPLVPQTHDSPIFLQVPTGLPSNVEDLARQLGEGQNRGRDVLVRIEDFLAKNNVYDLNAPALDTNEDFVEKFLFKDKRGYCVHFASAFIILARLNNIPARYVSGYLLNPIDEPTGTGKRLITGLSSHAWAEVWLPERGWLAWEATPAVNLAYYTQNPQNNFSGRSLFSTNSYTLRQLSGILGRNLLPSQEPTAGPTDNPLLDFFLVLLPPAGLGLALIGLAVWLTLHLFRRLQEYFYPRQAALQLLKNLTHGHKALPAPCRQGWLQWFSALKAHQPEISQQCDNWQAIALKALYSAHNVERQEVQSLKGIHKALRKIYSPHLF